MSKFKIPFSNLFNKAKGSDGKDKNLSADVSEAMARLFMPIVVKQFLSAIPKEWHDKLIKSKDSMMQTIATAAPVIIGGFTNFSELTDDIIADFFEEMKREVEARKHLHTAVLNENEARIKLLDLLQKLDTDNKLNYTKKFNDIFDKTPYDQRPRLATLLYQLSVDQLKTLLGLNPEAQDAYLSFSGVSGVHKGADDIVSMLRKVKTIISDAASNLDKACAEGGETAKFLDSLEEKAKEFYTKSKTKNQTKINAI